MAAEERNTTTGTALDRAGICAEQIRDLAQVMAEAKGESDIELLSFMNVIAEKAEQINRLLSEAAEARHG